MDPIPNVLDQHCESRQALDRIADKWTCLVVYALVDGPRRHGELRRTIEGISQKMLTQTLRSLEDDGLITRKVHPVVPPMYVTFPVRDPHPEAVTRRTTGTSSGNDDQPGDGEG